MSRIVCQFSCGAASAVATKLTLAEYGDRAIKVFETVGYIKGQNGAACTTRIKRGLLRTFEQPGDVLVLGYTAEEKHRLDDWLDNWPDRPIITPLIDRGLTTEDCKAMVLRAGIRLPAMYELGYDNANCIGCVKGGEGYFRAIREDFPEQFEKLAAVQEDLGEGAFLFRNRATGERYSLRDIPAGPIRRNEALPACSFFCEIAEIEYSA